MPDFGIDILGVRDIDPALTFRGGFTAYAQAIARRLTTPHGMLFYDPDYGYDLRQFVNGVAQRLDVIEAMVRAECLKDPRTLNATVTASPDLDTLNVKVRLDTDAGPFALTIAVSQLTVEILAENL